MKKLLLAVACCVAAVGVYAQPQINWANKVSSAGVTFLVTDAVGGAKLGADFFAGLYVGKTADSLTQATVGGVVLALPFKMVSGAGSGVYSTGALTSIDGFTWGDKMFVASVAWDKNYTTLEVAKTTDVGGGKSAKFGMSNTISIDLPKDATGQPPTLGGITAYTVDAVVIPEPSIMALGLLGGAAFLLRRRS